jgi:hypothetical protein
VDDVQRKEIRASARGARGRHPQENKNVCAL